MTNDEFKYWIKGYLALSNDIILDNQQINIIKNHANLVKTISQYLENSIIQFLENIDEKIKNNEPLKFSELKLMFS